MDARSSMRTKPEEGWGLNGRGELDEELRNGGDGGLCLSDGRKAKSQRRSEWSGLYGADWTPVELSGGLSCRGGRGFVG